MIIPSVHSHFGIVEFSNNFPVCLAEISVTRQSNRVMQRPITCIMTFHKSSRSVIKSVTTSKRSVCINHLFLQANKSGKYFKWRTWGITPLQAAVKHRLTGTTFYLYIVSRTISPDHQTWVVIRCGNQSQYFARFRLNRHNTTSFILHQFFTISLQFSIYRNMNISTFDYCCIVNPVFERSDFTVKFIPLYITHTFRSAKVFFISLLDALYAN